MDESRRNQTLLFVGIVALILLCIPIGYFVFLKKPELPPTPPPKVEVDAGVPKQAAELRLQEVQGEVEIRTASGEWKKAEKGQTLKASDAVRTKDGSYALLVGGEAYEVKMEA